MRPWYNHPAALAATVLVGVLAVAGGTAALVVAGRHHDDTPEAQDGPAVARSWSSGSSHPTTAPAAGEPGRKAGKGQKVVYTRDEFRKALAGKTGEEIIALLGRPDSTNDSSNWGPRWIYDFKGRNWVVHDPVSGKDDTAVSLHLRRDPATGVIRMRELRYLTEDVIF